LIISSDDEMSIFRMNTFVTHVTLINILYIEQQNQPTREIELKPQSRHGNVQFVMPMEL